MYKKVLMAVLLLTTVLYVTACGKKTETVTDESAGSPSVESPSSEMGGQNSTEEDSQSTNEGTENSGGEASQPAGEADESSCSFIFSDMPVAAYEVTGLGVGRFESVKEDEIYVEADEYNEAYSVYYPLIRLTPGENTFILFCIPGDDSEDYTSSSTIHSPFGSSQWEAITYTCVDGYFPTVEGFSRLTRQDTGDYIAYVYNEETYDGGINSIIDPWLDWLRFAAIYHPDAQQDDTIYAIEVETFPDDPDYGDVDGMLAGMIKAFDYLGGTLEEIPVEEALERCNVMVSQEE